MLLYYNIYKRNNGESRITIKKGRLFFNSTNDRCQQHPFSLLHASDNKKIDSLH